MTRPLVAPSRRQDRQHIQFKHHSRRPVRLRGRRRLCRQQDSQSAQAEQSVANHGRQFLGAGSHFGRDFQPNRSVACDQCCGTDRRRELAISPRARSHYNDGMEENPYKSPCDQSEAPAAPHSTAHSTFSPPITFSYYFGPDDLLCWYRLSHRTSSRRRRLRRQAVVWPPVLYIGLAGCVAYFVQSWLVATVALGFTASLSPDRRAHQRGGGPGENLRFRVRKQENQRAVTRRVSIGQRTNSREPFTP